MTSVVSRRFHLILDAFDCKKGLGDESFILKMIDEIVHLLDMKIIKGPVVANLPEVGNPDITAFAIINFSHISIHTFTSENKFYLDIFSCKSFDYLKLKDYIKGVFELNESQIFITSLEEPAPSEQEPMGNVYKVNVVQHKHVQSPMGERMSE